ncbi:MAG: hypothetical protein RLP45_09005, partial [Haliea sp.]
MQALAWAGFSACSLGYLLVPACCAHTRPRLLVPACYTRTGISLPRRLLRNRLRLCIPTLQELPRHRLHARLLLCLP